MIVTDDDNSQEMRDCADEYVRRNRKAIVDAVTSKVTPEKNPVSIFMAGSPGAGKTETSIQLLSRAENVLRIDADELRECFRECGYDGANSHIFQKAATRLVHEIHNAALKKRINFLLDGTFAVESVARENIRRSLKRGRSVYVVFVYQAPAKAWHFVQQREAAEGRRVRPKDFAKKFCASQEVANKMKAEFGEQVMLDLVYKDLDNAVEFYKSNVDNVLNYIGEQYTEAQILREIQGRTAGHGGHVPGT